MSQSASHVIAEHNDRFRRGTGDIPGQIVVTAALHQHVTESAKTLTDVMDIVRSFDQFDADNDPHGEHDFGMFQFAGETCYWKLDLYNLTLDGYTEDPTDPAKTHRVLTIMLASDY